MNKDLDKFIDLIENHFNEIDLEEFVDEDRIYQADELCFSLYRDFDNANGILVQFSELKYFKENGYCSDNLGGHNIDNEALKEAGVCDGELMESVFEIIKPISLDETHNNLIKAGFIFDKDFDKFIQNYINSKQYE